MRSISSEALKLEDVLDFYRSAAIEKQQLSMLEESNSL